MPISRAIVLMRRGLFLDRDGTLIADSGYLADPDGVVVLPGVPEALRRARAAGWRLYLFTNQSGVGRGWHTLDQVQAVNARMVRELGFTDTLFDGTCIATEHPDEPAVYRKPSPRFIVETIAADGLDPAACWMVGDRQSDAQAGLAAGIHAALLQTDKTKDLRNLPEVVSGGAEVFGSFSEFVESLLGRRMTQG